MTAGPDKGGVEKKPGAFRTIGELARDIGRPQHILRYWETRFPQLKPLQRAGGRRYYRAEDVALVRRIDDLLDRQGYTIRGVQRLLASEMQAVAKLEEPGMPGVADLRRIRDRLSQALQLDGAVA